MATNLNAGFTNNINIIQYRAVGSHSDRVTDRAIDIDADNDKETVSIVVTSGSAIGTPSAPGGKIRQTVTIPAGVARTVIQRVYETDGGVSLDRDVSEFTEGVE